jgi:cysteinyl-tRNA synthetase
MTEKSSKDIWIYNTIKRNKEEFKPIVPDNVSMYICGPTVYSFIHIGNARPLIFFDVVRRYFQYCGYTVKYVQNITDVDDKIIARAQEENTTTDDIAKQYIQHFRNDCEALGVFPPDAIPKASEYIDPMVALIKKLVDIGFAYVAEGNVFFETAKDSEYGILSGKGTDLHHMEIGERVSEGIQQLKKDPRDFSLWKPAKPGEPRWESPWGPGRPGWHTECVAMSIKELGKEFDIHAGGIDLIFPHHENEIAQARCGENAGFARFWMHNEFVNMKDRKMAKSEGNVILVYELTKTYSAEAIRLFFLGTDYRKPISFDEEFIASAQSALEKFERVLQKVEDYFQKSEFELSEDEIKKNYVGGPGGLDHYEELSIEAMNDDFNTAIVIREMFGLINALDGYSDNTDNITDLANLKKGVEILRKLDSFMGIIPKREIDTDSEAIEVLIGKRNVFRAERNWTEADSIRNSLLDMGVMLEDKKEGTRWWRKGKIV